MDIGLYSCFLNTLSYGFPILWNWMCVEDPFSVTVIKLRHADQKFSPTQIHCLSARLVCKLVAIKAKLHAHVCFRHLYCHH